MRAGLFAGVCAGAVLLAFRLLLNASQGGSAWPVLKEPGLPLFRASTVEMPSFELWPVFFGLALHSLISAGWGGLFGLLFFGVSRPATLLAGLGWGVVVWLAMFYVALPLSGAFPVTRRTPVAFAVSSHLLFGLTTALAYLPFQRPLKRRIPARRRRAPG